MTFAIRLAVSGLLLLLTMASAPSRAIENFSIGDCITHGPGSTMGTDMRKAACDSKKARSRIVAVVRDHAQCAGSHVRHVGPDTPVYCTEFLPPPPEPDEDGGGAD